MKHRLPRHEDFNRYEFVARLGEDFGTLLALTQASSPSVVQVRAQNILPSHLAELLIPVLRKNEELLQRGALIVVDEGRSRVRILPLKKQI